MTRAGATIFVFLQVGSSDVAPLLVASIRRTMPDARIIQCSDPATPPLPGITERFESAGDTAMLMTMRLRAFADLGLDEPAVYLDTDMLLVRPIEPAALLNGADVAVCARSFDRDAPFNTAFQGMDLRNYQGQTLGAVYPFVACCTLTRSAAFWRAALATLEAMPPQFHRWFGDQEAIRDLVAAGTFRTTRIPEAVYGCLPEHIDRVSTRPRLLHFKGAARKPLMHDTFARLFRR